MEKLDSFEKVLKVINQLIREINALNERVKQLEEKID